MSSEVKLPKFDPRLDRTGRPWRVDSEWAFGMPVGAFMWLKHPSVVPDSTRSSIQTYHKPRKNVEQANHISFVPDSARSSIQTDNNPWMNVEQANDISESEVAMINGLLTPDGRGPYALLPFRALEAGCVPAAIQQRWEASVAASRATQWRQWFGALDENQQKAHVQSLSKIAKDTFWAGLWLAYEERSKPGHPRLVAAAVRAVVIFERELAKIQMKDQEEALRSRKTHNAIRNRKLKRFGLVNEESGSLPIAHAGPSSAPLTPHDIKFLNLRLAPCYFRLPANALRFATQVFSGKSYEEAVKEQKSNFNSWAEEGKVCRVMGRPDLVVWDNVAVPKDPVCKVDSQEEEAEEAECPGCKGTRPSYEDQLKNMGLMGNGTIEMSGDTSIRSTLHVPSPRLGTALLTPRFAPAHRLDSEDESRANVVREDILERM